MILEHDHPFVHWDLLLEWGETARTWRLLAEPTDDAVAKGIAAEPLGDHRLFYLDYEGPVSGDRGHVTQWDAGTFEVLDESGRSVGVDLTGRRLAGRFIVRWDEGADGWTFQRSGSSES